MTLRFYCIDGSKLLVYIPSSLEIANDFSDFFFLLHVHMFIPMYNIYSDTFSLLKRKYYPSALVLEHYETREQIFDCGY